MKEIASLSIGTESLLEERVALLGFVLYVVLLVLEEFFDAVGKLTFAIVSTETISQIIYAELVL